ncbi:MAG: hypothetical protein M9911_07845 [Saprospiraceae bacterium]|nr:hypothetical protein [Saprospiraceae bacterium]
MGEHTTLCTRTCLLNVGTSGTLDHWPRYLPAVVILANGAKTTSHIERRYLPSGRYHRPT